MCLARALAARGEAGEARALLTSCVPALESYALMPRSIKAEVGRLRDRLR